MNITYYGDSIVLASSKQFAYVFGGIGLIMIIVAFLFRMQLTGNQYYIKQVLTSMGILFVAGALVFILYQKNIRVLINEPQGKITFSELYAGKASHISFPLSDFKRLDIYQSINTTKSAGSSSTKSVRYQVHLIRGTNSPANLHEFADISEALVFANKFSKATRIPVHLFLSPASRTYTVPSGLGTGITVHNESPLETWKAITQEDMLKNTSLSAIQLPKNPHLKITNQNNEVFLTWTAKHSMFLSLLLTIIGLSFLYLIVRVVLPQKGLSLPSGIGLAIAGVFTLLSIFMFVYSIWGKPQLILGQNEVRYETTIFGKQMYRQAFAYDSIKLIWNSMDTGTNDQLVLISDAGLATVFSMYDPSNQNISNVMSAVFNIGSYMMAIDMRPMSYTERLYIENLITDKIRGRLSTQPLR